MKKAIARLLLAALVLALAFGCADRNQEEPEGLYLWFPVNPALGEVSGILDACPYTGEDRSIPGLLSALLAGPPEDGARRLSELLRLQRRMGSTVGTFGEEVL